MIDAVTKPKTRVRTKTERPRLHKVILVNDDFTPREFVVTVLKANNGTQGCGFVLLVATQFGTVFGTTVTAVARVLRATISGPI